MFEGRRTETLNDSDGWLVNTYRAIQLSPDKVAEFVTGPVTEIDYHARLAWLQARRGPELVSWLEGDPDHHDAKAAAFWLYVCACGIGNPFDPGPWWSVDGHLRKMGTKWDGDAGQGVNRELPHLGDAGQGVNRTTNPALVEYMRRLSTRLQRVRIICGSWTRAVKPSVIRAGVGGDRSRSVFLDPPYASSSIKYTADDEGVSAQVRQWCETADPKLRIVLCGYDDEHDDLLNLGWRKVQGKSGGGAGYAGGTKPMNGRRERLYVSPACLDPGEGSSG